ncbi:MAG: hypothetical protein COV75_00355 [Candidatus Omnitrophica bacterium CG11_big_fil_rev_8_21_14_0_20_63_9]|nr:MAG: hypothetical protein COV75_00355 [Candidatus Omnitrophica bacterium CG11_big_fil_rev_8_21_14_0_20_63_9]
MRGESQGLFTEAGPGEQSGAVLLRQADEEASRRLIVPLSDAWEHAVGRACQSVGAEFSAAHRCPNPG